MTEIVAVTGAEGFIGSHLVERLVRHGQRVRAMVLYNSFDSRGWLDTLPAEVLAEVEVLPVAHQPFHEVRADEALRTRHRDDLGH